MLKHDVKISMCRTAMNKRKQEIRMFLAIRDSGGLNSILMGTAGAESLQNLKLVPNIF